MSSGTRTAAINGALLAVVDALKATRKTGLEPALPALSEIVRDSVAAVSVGLVNGLELLDLDYSEDKDADVDFNIVMTGSGQYIEVQGSGEEATFTQQQLDRLLKLGKLGVDAITRQQRRSLGKDWPLRAV